jgi:sugar lactone lactonase YvrE
MPWMGAGGWSSSDASNPRYARGTRATRRGPHMIGPHSVLRILFLALPAIFAFSIHAYAAPPIERDLPAGAPAALRVERILDRAELDRLGAPNPSRLVFDADGSLYVLDPGRRRVVKLDPRGVPVLEWGGYGGDETSFSVPSDLAIDRRQSLLVLDRGKSQIAAFDGVGRYLGFRALGADVQADALDPAARLLVDPFGSLWLLAVRERDLVELNDRLERERRTRYLAPEESVGAPGTAAFLPDQGGWIHDAERGLLRRFGAGGRLLGSIPLRDSTGTIVPADLACDTGGSLYVADAEGQRILVYSATGVLELERQLGGPGIPWKPRAIAVSRFDRVAIADPSRGEIQILSVERRPAPAGRAP